MTAELRRLNRALRALCECNAAIVQASDEATLLESLCQTLVSVGGYRMVWVGVPDSGPECRVRVAACAGVDDGYLECVRIHWADDEFGQGPTGVAIRTGEIAINRNSVTNPDYQPWRAEALRRGYRSSAAIPLLLDGAILGALAVYSTEPEAFDTDETLRLRCVKTSMCCAGGLGSRARASNFMPQGVDKTTHGSRRALACTMPTSSPRT